MIMKKGKGNANASLEIALRTTREAFFDGYSFGWEWCAKIFGTEAAISDYPTHLGRHGLEWPPLDWLDFNFPFPFIRYLALVPTFMPRKTKRARTEGGYFRLRSLPKFSPSPDKWRELPARKYQTEHVAEFGTRPPMISSRSLVENWVRNSRLWEDERSIMPKGKAVGWIALSSLGSYEVCH